MGSITQIIKEVISDRRNKKVIIDDDGFLFGLFDRPDDGKVVLVKRTLNLLLILCCAITCIVILIKSFVFYINDVLLFENKVFMNQQGAFVPMQSCDREYALFMFTSSDWWANTGVQVQKGDRIKIMASGAFNSSISALQNQANENSKLKYRWISAMPTQKGQDVERCIYRGENAYFGSILYQIQNSLSVELDPEDIKQLNTNDEEKEKFIDIDRNGTLFFAVNDIYMSPQIISQQDSANRAYAEKLKMKFGQDAVSIQPNTVLVRKIVFDEYSDSFPCFLPTNTEFVEVAGERFRKHFESYPTVWYEDNIGDVLICMEIEHVTENSYAQWYRECEAEFNSMEDRRNVGVCELINKIPNIIMWSGKAVCIFVDIILISLCCFVAINFRYCRAYRLVKARFLKWKLRWSRSVIGGDGQGT